MIVSFHLTHSSAGSDTLSDIVPCISEDADGFMRSVKNISEYVILRTCNRFEVYAVTSDNDATVRSFEHFARSKIPYHGKDVWYTLSDRSTVKHLFRVTCGLDSLVIGEDQIQGQVKEAYISAKEEGHISSILGLLFDKALHTGKRVRSETALTNGAISVGSAAVQLAEESLGGLSEKTVGIIGAGDMAEVIARRLSGTGLKTIFISNRTYENAKVLANDLGGTAVRFDALSDVLSKSDAVFVATSAPHIVLKKEMVLDSVAGRGSKLLLIDVSVPRNVSDDVASVKNVELHTMESIGSVSSKNMMKRYTEISEAELIVNEEIRKLDEVNRERMANNIISEIAKRASDIRTEEMNFALSRAKNGSDIEQVFDDFSRALVSKIMAEPFEKLKEASRNGRTDICNVATDLFGVDHK